ncbi:MAG: serine/threonine protein kinase [Phycisphaerae bacterium]|jgi:serine/threonine protein kinase|nr:serine/threonine protein kinase [Phycisphaerae bacterium]
MPDKDNPTDPDAETLDLSGDESGKGSLPEHTNLPSMGMPSEIGRYKIIGVIGQGGMGFVYEAMQESPRRRVALKVIKHGAVSKMALRRFEFETQILAKLHHPNIAQIYEAGTWHSTDGDLPFFAMEYIPGNRTLIEYANKRNLSIRDRLELFDKVCEAVHHGHQKGVIHRDLKPDNILVSSNGQPKIIDFGVARATDADLAVTTMQTTMGQLVGTLQYMSPEQCDADPDLIDTRSDVYSLGIILFQLLSGKLPYNLRKRAIHEAVRVIKEDRPDSMGTISSTLRGDIDTITLKSIEKDRELRYQSAAELANDVNRYLNNEPIIARPVSITYQLKMFAKKYKRTCAALFLLALSIILGVIGTSWGMIEAKRGWAEADLQLMRVQSRNEALGNSVSSLLSGVRDTVGKLGDSAVAQRSLLDLAKENMDAIQLDQEATPKEQAELAILLLNNATSNMSVSGVGFGNLDLAEKSLIEAGEVLDSINVESIEDERFALGISRMKLDRYKFLAELAQSRAEKLSGSQRIAMFKQAIDIWEKRDALGDKHYKETKDWKGLEVQWSSNLGIGNAHFKIEELENSKKAYETALGYMETIQSLVPDKSIRWKRGIGVTHYLIALVSSNPRDALSHLQIAIENSRQVIKAEPDNARRPRDLALMLSLRGQLRVSNDVDTDEGIQDLRESVILLTKRALESPRETATQNDFQEQLEAISSVLTEAGKPEEAATICNGAIEQMECIASAGAITGTETWNNIIEQLQSTLR